MKDTKNYDYLIKKLRKFFQDERRYVEVPVQSRLSPLLACEDPRTISTYSFRGETWPLPQSGQPELEVELLSTPSVEGVFCILTSFRDEPNCIPGRHETVFPLFEFEGRGGFLELKHTEIELLKYLGFEKPVTITYDDACEHYNTTLLTAEHELLMPKDFGNVVLLEKFPTRTNPYWNMKYAGNGIFNKVDVILYGMESMGSAERSCNIDEMRTLFNTVENGEYAHYLFEALGKERVQKELENYLALPMTPRYGAGVGIHRTLRAMKLAGIDADSVSQAPQHYVPMVSPEVHQIL